jgi:hypothetical protein
MTHFNNSKVPSLLSYQLGIVGHITIWLLNLQIIFRDAAIANMVSQPSPNVIKNRQKLILLPHVISQF